jgi:FtsP/CotA-like multicopper oxidase with cupredoxin domain
MSGMQHGDMSGMGGAGNGDVPALGAALEILRVRVAREEAETLTLPTTLSRIARYRLEDAVNRDNPRPVALSLQGMAWRINGKTFEMDAVAPEEVVALNSLEVWEIKNETNPGEMMDAMGMAHPIHIHGGQFQVVGREVLPELRAGWEGVRAGYIDEGWKDTVLVMPGERVTLLMAFRDYPGTYVYHCHNIEHEDAGMMRNYRVDA